MSNIPWQVIEPLVTIHPWSLEAIGPDLLANSLVMTSCAAAAWQSAAGALLIPFTLTKQATFVEAFWYNGAAVSSVDVGVYDTGGNLLGHTGSVSSSGNINLLQIAPLLASTKIGPGMFYLAISATSVVQAFFTIAAASVSMLQVMGCAYIGGDFPLATGKTIASVSLFTKIPIFGISTRSVL